jgi:hypothetical protein
MKSDRIEKEVQYLPKGNIHLVRPLKGWKDSDFL